MTEESAPTCPACGAAVEDARRVNSVTYVLDPCGHQVDEAVFADLFDEDR